MIAVLRNLLHMESLIPTLFLIFKRATFSLSRLEPAIFFFDLLLDSLLPVSSELALCSRM